MDAYGMLCQTLQKQSKDSYDKNTKTILEFGYINEDYGLYIDRFGSSIPKGDYLINSMLVFDDEFTSVTTSVAESHTHTVQLPLPAKQKITVGDRVIVCWVGNDPIVISVVTDSDNM